MNETLHLPHPVPRSEKWSPQNWAEYKWLNLIECNAFIDQIFDELGPPPVDVSIIIKENDSGLSTPTISYNTARFKLQKEKDALHQSALSYYNKCLAIEHWNDVGLEKLFKGLQNRGYFYSTRWSLSRFYDSLHWTNQKTP